MKPPVTLRTLEPLHVMGDCRRAALKADVSLAWWTEFSQTARACLSPDCEPEELEKFMCVVRERFEVTESK